MLKQEDTFVSTTMFVHKVLIRSIHIFPGCILESVSGWLYVFCQSNESVYTFCRITKSVFLSKSRQQLLLSSESYLCLKITRNRLPRSCYTEWYWEIYCFFREWTTNLVQTLTNLIGFWMRVPNPACVSVCSKTITGYQARMAERLWYWHSCDWWFTNLVYILH